MQIRALFVLASALLASGGSLCAAAPKVSIRIVSRMAHVDAPVNGPVPFRDPMVFWQGPFANAITSYSDPLPCVKETPVKIDGTEALLDVCHLRNVTLVKIPAPVAEPATENSESDAPAEPEEQRKILGIYRGWKMDAITRRYKQMVFDDGDECGEPGNRMRFVLDVVAAKSPSARTRVYDFRQLDACSFRAKMFVYVPPHEAEPQDSIHTPGILDVTDANETLPHVCAQVKCRFNTIMNKVRAVMGEVRQAESVAAEVVSAKTPALANFTLHSSKAILRASNAVLDRSLELLSTLEALQRSLQKQLDAAQRAADSAAAERELAEADAPASESAGSDAPASESEGVVADGSDSSASADESDAEQQQAVDGVQEVVVEVDG